MKTTDGSRRLAGLCLAVVLCTVGLVGLASPAAAATATATFEYTGGPQVWTVPASVHRVTIDAFGGSGGGGQPPWATGGLGGRTTATVVVSPGDQLQINVGGRGGDAFAGGGGEGGWNGGAHGGLASDVCDPGTCSWPGAGGGGASDVRVPQFNDLDSRIVVAGGGGGAAAGGDGSCTLNGTPLQADGGEGGGKIGGPAPCGGRGGTETAGGAGGDSAGGVDGVAGTEGTGGVGASSKHPDTQPQGGGGGGGGWYGGGGGGIGASIGDTGGGGGGSGRGPTFALFRSGVHAGVGRVEITFTVDTTPPVLNLPADISAAATSASGAAVSYNFSPSDADGVVQSQGCSPVSGSTFAIGETTVNCTATDDSGNTASESFRVTVRVQTTSLLNSSANPSVFGQPVALASDVCRSFETGPLPTGSVAFSEAGAPLGTAPLSDASSPVCVRAATDPITGFSVGEHALRSDYGGDTNNSASSATLAQLVQPAGTTLAITSSVDPSTYGQTVTFTATVSPQAPSSAPSSAPTGTVTFAVDGASVPPAAVTPGAPTPVQGQASLSLSTLTAPTHSVTAVYNGDGNFLGSSGAVTQTVNKASTTTALACGPDSSAFGQPIVCTATVSPAPGGLPASPPSGTVAVIVDGRILDDVSTLSPGPAPLTSSSRAVISTLAPGDHTISVSYSGDGNYLSSISASTDKRVTCSRTFSGEQSSSFTVAAGQQLCLDRATVKGSVKVQGGGALSMVNSTIGGSVTITEAQAVRLCGTRVGGSLTVTGSVEFVLIGGSVDPVDACAGNTIRGGATLSSNRAGLQIGRTSVAGSLVINNNAAGSGAHLAPAVEANTISGSLRCTGNAVMPINRGHPNTVRGSRSGQCVGL